MLFLVKETTLSVMNFKIGNHSVYFLKEIRVSIHSRLIFFFLALKSISPFNVLSEKLLSF